MIRRLYLKPVLGFVFLSIMAVMSGNTAYGAAQTLTISPASVSQSIIPGTTYTGTLDVINQGETDYKFKVYAAPYTVIGELYEPSYVYTPGDNQVSDWVKFEHSSFFIKAGDEKKVKYSIHVPLGIQPGGYYVAAFAETDVPKKEVGVTLNQRVGQLMYLEVPGRIKKEGNVVAWDAEIFQNVPLTAALRLQNSGGTHFVSRIDLYVRDILGGVKYNLKAEKYLLPKTIRRIDFQWDKSPEIGLFRVGGEVTIYDRTEQLPDRWVLVMSTRARIIAALSVVLIALGLIARHKVAKRRAAKAIQGAEQHQHRRPSGRKKRSRRKR